jgi:hypothetical protein
MSRNSPEKPEKPPSAAVRRGQRLAEALRANLKRRKVAGQAERADTPGKSKGDEE